MSKSSKSKPSPQAFKIMGVSVEPTNATKGTVSYAGNVGKVPNPAGGPTIQFSSNPRIRQQEIDEFIANHMPKTQPKGRK
jgi:hypothetical protein